MILGPAHHLLHVLCADKPQHIGLTTYMSLSRLISENNRQRKWQYALYEVLVPIFHFATDIGNIPFGIFTPLFPQTSITISHVCKHWRTIALAQPTLWCYVDFCAHRQWISFCLRRSGPTTPIHVCIDAVGWSSERIETAAIILSPGQLKRVVTLQVHVDKRSVFEFWHNVIRKPTPLPLLEYLAVEGTASLDSVSDTRFTNIPHEFFYGKLTPSLRRVYLHRVYIPFDGTAFRNPKLTHLALATTPLAVLQNDSDVWKILQSTHRLRHLLLSIPLTGLPPRDPDDPLPDEVHLTELEQLHFVLQSKPLGRAPPEQKFMRTIRTNARITVSALEGSYWPCPADVAHLPAFATVTAMLIYADFTADGSMLIRGFPRARDVDPSPRLPRSRTEPTQPRPVPSLQVNLKKIRSYRGALGSIKALLDVEPGRVTALMVMNWTVDSDASVPSATRGVRGSDWTSLLSLPGFQHIQDLHFSPVYSTAGEINLLFNALTVNPSSKRESLTCPALERLTVEAENEGQWDIMDYLALAECVQSRTRAGVRLKELRVNGPLRASQWYERSIRWNVDVITILEGY